MDVMAKIRKDVNKLLKNVDLIKNRKIDESLEIPPESEFGDLASNICFSISKKVKKPPQKIAQEIIDKIKIPKNSIISKVEAKAGYINFFFDCSKIAELTLKKILKEKNSYGSSNLGKKKTIMIEFAHPNTHKGFHIGHLRNVCIGECVSRLLEFTNHKVVRTNYQGDIGPHVAKCLWGFMNLYKGKPPKENKGEWLGKVYPRVNKYFLDDEKVNQEIMQINKKLYERDKEIVKIWKKTRKWSLNYFDEIYKELDTKFDKLYFESGVEKRAVEISKELLKKGIAELSEGAVIIDLTKYNLGVFVLLTGEGNPLYESKDLALAEKQFSDFDIDRCIHVVGSEQKLYFQQLLKVFDLIDSPAAGKSYHLIYELVSLKGGKMSSRMGTIVLYNELRDQILKKALKEVEKRNQKISKKKKKKLAEQIGIGALKYGMLSISCDKLLVFDWEKALRLEGNTGPYIQYAHTRCNGILSKANKWRKNYKNEKLTQQEKKLVKRLLEFPEICTKAVRDLRPHYICNYVYDLSTIFSEFYHTCPVLKAKSKKLKNFRLALVKATQITIKNCLDLLGIETPEKM